MQLLRGGWRRTSVYLNFSKAFDAVSHTILTQGLIKGRPSKWLVGQTKNWPNDQRVLNSGTKCSCRVVAAKVPWGLIILIVINYLADGTQQILPTEWQPGLGWKWPKSPSLPTPCPGQGQHLPLDQIVQSLIQPGPGLYSAFSTWLGGLFAAPPPAVPSI